MALRLRVGLSGKNDIHGRLYEPLCVSTNSGKIVKKLQELLPGVAHKNINLVAHAPLTSQGVLRYPTPEECHAGCNELVIQLQTLKPDVIVALGKQVQEHLRTIPTEYRIIEIPHPSYLFRRQKSLLNKIISELTNNK